MMNNTDTLVASRIKKGQRVEFRDASGRLLDGIAESNETSTHVIVRVCPANGIPGWGLVTVEGHSVVSYGYVIGH
jgi:hypothetical protein